MKIGDKVLDRREEDYNRFFKDVSTRPRVSLTSAIEDARKVSSGDGRLPAPGFSRAARVAPETPNSSSQAKDENNAALAQALAAFHLLLNLPRHFDEKHCREWHSRLVAQAKRLLELRRITFEETPLEDGLTQLVISPISGHSHLNEFAHDVARKLGGIAFVYSPKDLLKPEGKGARASFHREKNRILLPKGFLDHPRIDDAIYHEVLHAVFHDLLKNGISSLFHGWVRSLDRKRPMWNSPQYRFRMSLEELATHALNLHLIAEDWRSAIDEKNRETAFSLQKRLRRKSTTLFAIGTEAAGLLERALIALEMGTSLRLEFHRPQGEDVGLTPVLWARLTFEGIEVKLPLLPGTEDVALRWERHVNGQREVTVRDEISELFRRRIEMQRKIAEEIATQADSALQGLAILDESVPPSVPSELWEILCGPRILSFQYLRWGDSHSQKQEAGAWPTINRRRP